MHPRITPKDLAVRVDMVATPVKCRDKRLLAALYAEDGKHNARTACAGVGVDM